VQQTSEKPKIEISKLAKLVKLSCVICLVFREFIREQPLSRV